LIFNDFLTKQGVSCVFDQKQSKTSKLVKWGVFTQKTPKTGGVFLYKSIACSKPAN